MTGVCGYVGSRLISRVLESSEGIEIIGIDNLSRPGSETAIQRLTELGVRLYRGDIRLASDVMALPEVDWVIDCAANPSVTAGLDVTGWNSSRQLVEHNLLGTLNLLEFCKYRSAGLVLLSTSRVYSIGALRALPLREEASRFVLEGAVRASGCSQHGIAENFSTASPVSLYGATKLASERLAVEYGQAFGFPVWVNRCGVIGGPGQYGRFDQGVLSFWAYAFMLGHPLRYIGFGGSGKQVRDFIQAEDVADLVLSQVKSPSRSVERVFNVGGGNAGSFSLVEVTEICRRFFGSTMAVSSSFEQRANDIPYFVTDARRARMVWDWEPVVSGENLVLAVCRWATEHRGLVESFFVGGVR